MPIYPITPCTHLSRPPRNSGRNTETRQKKWGLQMKGTLPFRPSLNVRQVQDCPIYAGMIEQLDRSIGIVLAKLDEHGLDKNTIICFTSDNGGVSSGMPMPPPTCPSWRQGQTWEGGFVNPSILKLPHIERWLIKFHSS